MVRRLTLFVHYLPRKFKFNDAVVRDSWIIHCFQVTCIKYIIKCIHTCMCVCVCVWLNSMHIISVKTTVENQSCGCVWLNMIVSVPSVDLVMVRPNKCTFIFCLSKAFKSSYSTQLFHSTFPKRWLFLARSISWLECSPVCWVMLTRPFHGNFRRK